MLPDLGRYTIYVLSSYGVTLALMLGLVWLSVRRSAKVKAQLDKLEAARKD